MLRFKPRPEHRPRSTAPSGRSVRLRWLGTAGHVLETDSTTLLFDPFLTRPGLLQTAGRPLEPTPERWWHWLPDRVDAILVGHSHYDHLMDAPLIAKRTGATIVGSRTTACFAAAAGVAPERIVTVPPEGRALDVGEAHVRFVPSQHARIAAGRVPFSGEVTLPPRLPARIWQYRMGGAYGIHVTVQGKSVYHNGSADLVDGALEGLHADVAFVGLAGRQVTPRYLQRLYGLLRPQLVVPTHHDQFFAPLEQGVRLLPGIDLDRFARETARLSDGTEIRTPTYEDVLHVPMEDSPREAVVGPL
jgi:L-ascorbate metabolism protein UlaG (beta-lactamase superfamily)